MLYLGSGCLSCAFSAAVYLALKNFFLTVMEVNGLLRHTL